MNQEELQVAAFEIILHSGTARTEIHEAFADMREGRFDEDTRKSPTVFETTGDARLE